MNYHIDQYILDAEGKPVFEPDLDKWAKSNSCCRSIKITMLAGVKISTIFLGLDHNHWGGEPILWETMVIGGKLNQTQRRATTRENALTDHFEMVMEVYKTLPWWRRAFARFWGEVWS